MNRGNGGRLGSVVGKGWGGRMEGQGAGTGEQLQQFLHSMSGYKCSRAATELSSSLQVDFLYLQEGD